MAEYYVSCGNPSWLWMGAGSAQLEIVGTPLPESQMRALFGRGLHPDAVTKLGPRYPNDADLEPYISGRARVVRAKSGWTRFDDVYRGDHSNNTVITVAAIPTIAWSGGVCSRTLIEHDEAVAAFGMVESQPSLSLRSLTEIQCRNIFGCVATGVNVRIVTNRLT